ncbi:WD repeat-containing protein 13, partial [Desmophyllum pertusum]
HSVTVIKFAHGDKYRLACSSTDGTLSVCALVPSPPSVTCTLRGHTAAVADFEWTMNNDKIASASLDRTTRVWNPESGKCLRVLDDSQSCGVMACRFQPLNNNLLLVSFKIDEFAWSNGSKWKPSFIQIAI